MERITRWSSQSGRGKFRRQYKSKNEGRVKAIMDTATKQQTEAREKLTKLERQIADYTAKLRTTEGDLAKEHGALRELVSWRNAEVAKLASANTEDAEKIHKSLDELESAIRIAERRAASLQTLVKTINAAMSELGTEQAKLGQQIAQVENEAAFVLEREELEHGFAELGDLLVFVRGRMAELNEKSAKFGERFKGPAYNVIAPLFDTFLSAQANMEGRGFRFAYGFRQDFRVVLNPMVPR